MNTLTFRGRVAKDLGHSLIVEFRGGRFFTLPKHQLKISIHKSKWDYIELSEKLAVDRGIIRTAAPGIMWIDEAAEITQEMIDKLKLPDPSMKVIVLDPWAEVKA